MKNIKIVYGRNGSDIHRRMRSKVADFAAHAAAEDSAFFIVPDQYTLTAERFLLAAVGEKALRNIRVVLSKGLRLSLFPKKAKRLILSERAGVPRLFPPLSMPFRRSLNIMRATPIFILTRPCANV